MKFANSAVLFLALFCCTFGFSQISMTPQYSIYDSLTVTSDGVLHSVVTISGQTVGQCCETVVCGPNGQTCQFCDSHCVGAQHQPQVIAGQNGGPMTQFNGPFYSPFSYFTYSNEVDTIIPSDGTPAGPDQTSQVFCTGLASTLIVIGFHPRYAFLYEKTHTTSQTPSNTTTSPWSCTEEPWCTPATTPPALNITTFLENHNGQGPLGPDGLTRTNACSPYYKHTRLCVQTDTKAFDCVHVGASGFTGGSSSTLDSSRDQCKVY